MSLSYTYRGGGCRKNEYLNEYLTCTFRFDDTAKGEYLNEYLSEYLLFFDSSNIEGPGVAISGDLNGFQATFERGTLHGPWTNASGPLDTATKRHSTAL